MLSNHDSATPAGIATAMPAALAELMPVETMPDGGAVILRPRDEADLQRLVEVMDLLREAGFTDLILIE